MTYTQLIQKAAAVDRWWLFFAIMNTVNPIIPVVKLDGLTQKASDILANLQQAGLFKAIVIARSGNNVLLDTSFGKISGKAPENLQKGDEIMARLLPGKSEPAIKIEQLNPRILNLPKSSLKNVTSHNIPLPVVARVVSHNGRNTQLHIVNQTFKVPRMDMFQTGQRVLLQSRNPQQLQIKPLYPENILKTALSSLIPKNLNNPSGHSLTTLQKLSSELLNSNLQQLQSRVQELSVKQGLTADKSGHTPVLIPNKQAPPEQASQLTDRIKVLLDKVASPAAQIQGIKPQSIQQLLVYLSLLKPASTQHATGGPKSLPDTLMAVLNELRSSPEAFNKLIRQIFDHGSGNNDQKPGERSLLQISNSLRNELYSQTEQTLNQLLTQKSTLNLQVEQNQPIQINLNIPLQVKDEIRNLKLKIKEKQKQEIASEQHWEINLSFEFAMLGLISTHILLQDTRLSAHFRAEHEATRFLIDSHMHEFKSQLSKSGFELGLFDCQQGQIVEEDEPGPLRSGDNFVDIKV